VYSERLIGWGGHKARMGEIRNAHNILVGKHYSKILVRYIYEDRARSAFYVERETSAKFGPHAGNINFNMENEECNRLACSIVPVRLSIQHVQQKYTEYNRETLKKGNLETWLGCRYFQLILK
jgi:hypothetical protein